MKVEEKLVLAERAHGLIVNSINQANLQRLHAEGKILMLRELIEDGKKEQHEKENRGEGVKDKNKDKKKDAKGIKKLLKKVAEMAPDDQGDFACPKTGDKMGLFTCCPVDDCEVVEECVKKNAECAKKHKELLDAKK